MKCEACGRSIPLSLSNRVVLDGETICKECFEGKFGKIILRSTQGRYYGGHKAYPVGGLSSKEASGQLYLTDNYVVFVNVSIFGAKWKIVVPLDKVELEGWTVREEKRRTEFYGGSWRPFAPFFDPFKWTWHSGVLWERGKKHQIVLPYIDENGIPQAPRFAVASLLGGAVKKWAKAIYEGIVEIRKQKPIVEEEQEEGEPLGILKLRLAKGEITKEEYEELRKMITSQ